MAEHGACHGNRAQMAGTAINSRSCAPLTRVSVGGAPKGRRLKSLEDVGGECRRAEARAGCGNRRQRAEGASGLPFKAFEMSAIAFCARTLLPASSSGGETTAMPNLPGETAMIPPPTPLFPGRPV